MSLSINANTSLPILSIGIYPKTEADQEKLTHGLQRLAAEDPTFQFEPNFQSGQTILSGMDELHLDIIIDRLKCEFEVEADIFAPQVVYRKTIRQEIECIYTHKRKSLGSDQFAELTLVVSPAGPLRGFSFESRVTHVAIPKEYIHAAERGVLSVIESGPMSGGQVNDIKVALVDGKFHDVKSSALAFEIAGRMCLRKAIRNAGVKTLEPIMKVTVLSPGEYTGDIIGDLTSRRGLVRGQEINANSVVLDALVPFSNLFGYISSLQSLSSGRAKFTMQFDHFAETPTNSDPDDTTPVAMAMKT